LRKTRAGAGRTHQLNSRRLVVVDRVAAVLEAGVAHQVRGAAAPRGPGGEGVAARGAGVVLADVDLDLAIVAADELHAEAGKDGSREGHGEVRLNLARLGSEG